MRQAFGHGGLGLATLLSLACSGPTDGGAERGERLTIVARPGTADTIFATPVQALVAEVRDESGEVATGTVVRFAGLPPEVPHFQPSMLVGSIQGGDYTTFLAEPTDGQGRASARVRYGLVAGTGRIEVAVPVLGLADTVEFTIQPGRPAAVQISPRDTAVYAGAAVQLRGRVVDRFQNERPEPVTFAGTSTPPGIGLVNANGQVTTNAEGRIRVMATFGSILDTTGVSVVPRGTIVVLDVAVSPGAVVLLNLDGSGRRVLRALPGFEPSWSPSGTEVAVMNPVTPVGIVRIALDGTVTAFPPAGPGIPYQYWPDYSPDGQFIYFSALQGGDLIGIWRAKTDGTGFEPVTVGVHFRPSLSPDGTNVTFHTVDQVTGDVVVRVYDIVNRTLHPGSTSGRFPEWAPMGTDIAMLDNFGRIVTAPLIGGGTRLLTPVGRSYPDGQLAWSPDARWLLVRGPTALELIEVSTGLLLPLGFTGSYSDPAWKPDN